MVNLAPHKKLKYTPDKEYIITAKFKMTGDKIELFIPRLKNAFVHWIEENRGRYAETSDSVQTRV